MKFHRSRLLLGAVRKFASPQAIGCLLAGVAAFSAAPAAAQSNLIVVVVREIKPLDRFDSLSRGDIFARVTINGEAQSTAILKQAARPGETIRTNLTVTKRVNPGTHDVRLELLDKDMTKDELIDINRIENRRYLDFTVNTRTCRIEGFATTYKCNARITRAGTEPKAAEITFTVSVTR